MDNVPVELVLKDLEGRYLMVNRHFEKLNGVTDEGVRGKLPRDVFESASAETLHEHDMEVLRCGATQQFEIVQDLGDDAWTFLYTGFPIRRPDGRLTGLGAVATDVTQLKKSEDALKRLNEELEARVEARTAELSAVQEDLVRHERLAAIGEVAATVSHELRNPLSAIGPSLYVLRKGVLGGDERTAAAIARIDRNLRRCDRLIEDLLDFARVGQPGDKPLPLDPWLASVADELANRAAVPLQRCLAAPGVQVTIDEDRMRRAVVNVWTNACQAFANSEAGRQPRIVVSSQLVRERVEIIVEDNGPGIADNVKPRLFEPLFSTKGFGTGLGLSTVKQIMERHHGGVEVASTVGEGTTVTLWLPQHLSPG
jgi:PAS domain S-box-containing protein